MKIKEDIRDSQLNVFDFCAKWKNQKYYENPEGKTISNNKIFLKIVKPYISGKIMPREQITLIEKDKVFCKTVMLLCLWTLSSRGL